MSKRLSLIIRLFLGVTFIIYAFAKFSGSQFSRLDINAQINDVDSITLVWYFFGYSHVYGLIIAIGQFFAGIFTIWNKTYRLGILIYFFMAFNIAVMDWCFELPIQASILATSLAVLSLVIIIDQRREYMKLSN